MTGCAGAVTVDHKVVYAYYRVEADGLALRLSLSKCELLGLSPGGSTAIGIGNDPVGRYLVAGRNDVPPWAWLTLVRVDTQRGHSQPESSA